LASASLDDQIPRGRLSARANVGKFKASIGSTGTSAGEHLIDDNSATQPLTKDDMSEADSDEEDDPILDNSVKASLKGRLIQTRQWSVPFMLGDQKEWIQLICLRSRRLI
jgi:hypothetical protein